MDKNFYADRIDAYLNFELSERERVMFENMIEQDPILKSELDFQREIIEAIRLKRKLELKNRLDKVPIDSIQIFHLPRLALAGTLVAASLIMGVLVFFEYKEEQVNKGIANEKVSVYLPKNENIISSTQKSTLPNDNKQENLTEVTPSNQTDGNTESVKNIPIKVLNGKVAQKKINPSKIKKSELVLEKSTFEIEDLQFSKNTFSPKSKIDLGTTQQISRVGNPAIDKEDKGITKVSYLLRKESSIDNISFDRKDTDNDIGIFDGKNESTLENTARLNKLSYQHYNGVLFVYNDNASRKEQFSLNENGLVRHFLYYEDTFYEFFIDVTITTEMLPVMDIMLAQSLAAKRKEIIKK